MPEDARRPYVRSAGVRVRLFELNHSDLPLLGTHSRNLTGRLVRPTRRSYEELRDMGFRLNVPEALQALGAPIIEIPMSSDEAVASPSSRKKAQVVRSHLPRLHPHIHVLIFVIQT